MSKENKKNNIKEFRKKIFENKHFLNKFLFYIWILLVIIFAAWALSESAENTKMKNENIVLSDSINHLNKEIDTLRYGYSKLQADVYNLDRSLADLNTEIITVNYTLKNYEKSHTIDILQQKISDLQRLANNLSYKIAETKKLAQKSR